MIKIDQIHHVAYRCKDAKETVEFYQKYLNMDLLVSITEDKISSTRESNRYIRIFLDAGKGNILAFFEITDEKEMSRDLKTPVWVQHISFLLKDEQALKNAKIELEEKGVEVLGLTDHGIFKSIYFFDPNGHRLELTCLTGTDEERELLKSIAPRILEEWSETKNITKK